MMRLVWAALLVCLYGLWAVQAAPKRKAPCLQGSYRCGDNDECCSKKCFGGKCQYGYGCVLRGKCTYNADCCSNKCPYGDCQKGSKGCVTEGKCTFKHDCCSRICQADRTCVARTGCLFKEKCERDDDCCSRNCYKGMCQPGANMCTYAGFKCRLNAECCSHACMSYGCRKPSGKKNKAPEDG